MRDFRTLQVWQKAYQLTLDVYLATKRFPREELYGLTSQTRRSAASVAANIAEGCGRIGGAELSRFIQIAMGSASELEFHLLLAHDLGMLSETDFASLSNHAVEVKRMLTAFWQKLRAES
ncbi:MAG TPA: four helix bundle protein [Terriglobia bacterium]|nr:four helix bundle protein [Terriglobia bacterium]